MRTLIDTRLWVLSVKRKLHPAHSEPHELGRKATQIIEEALSDDRVLVSAQLAAELFGVATGRGKRIDPAVMCQYLDSLLAHRSVRFSPIRQPHVTEAARRSADSGIHIWDFLVVLPFRDEIDRIITMDPHFQDAAFSDLGRVENPLGVWRIEGQP